MSPNSVFSNQLSAAVKELLKVASIVFDSTFSNLELLCNPFDTFDAKTDQKFVNIKTKFTVSKLINSRA